MVKSINAKVLRPLLLLICFALFCCLSGCGNKEDEITPTTGTGQQIASFTASPTSLAAGQTSILTVKVTDSSGAVVIGATVSFELVTNNSDATLTTLNGGITDAGGQALAVYTAGTTNPTADVQDTVQASVTGATNVIFITRSATSSATYSINLSSGVWSNLYVTAGESDTITARVTDDSYSATVGVNVNFSFFSNKSGATLDAVSGITDGSGETSVLYTAGTTTGVQDILQASVEGSTATAFFIIDVTP